MGLYTEKCLSLYEQIFRNIFIDFFLCLFLNFRSIHLFYFAQLNLLNGHQFEYPPMFTAHSLHSLIVALLAPLVVEIVHIPPIEIVQHSLIIFSFFFCSLGHGGTVVRENGPEVLLVEPYSIHHLNQNTENEHHHHTCDGCRGQKDVQIILPQLVCDLNIILITLVIPEILSGDVAKLQEIGHDFVDEKYPTGDQEHKIGYQCHYVHIEGFERESINQKGEDGHLNKDH